MKKRKSYSNFFAFAIGFCATAISSMSAQAYTYISASHSDNLLGSSTTYGLRRSTESASIDYCTGTSCTSPKQLSAMIHFDPDAGGSGTAFPGTGLFVTDGVSIVDVSSAPPATPYWTWANSPLSYPYGYVSCADVVIGNGSTLSTFNLGVLYCFQNSTGTNTVELDLYTVSNPGGTLTVTYNTSVVYSTSSPDDCARIDMIADYGHLLSTGKPNCDRFVATWGEYAGQKAYSASLSSPSGGASTYFSSSNYFWEDCDIAGIQRTGVKGNDNVALFTYYNGTSLLYKEWNTTTGSVSAPMTLGSSGSGFEFARIDAIDNPSLQSSGNNNWVVVAGNNTVPTIAAYSDAHPSALGLGSISYTASPSCGNAVSVVSVGPGNVYTIGFYDNGNFKTNTVDFAGTTINPVGYVVNHNSFNSLGLADMVILSSTCNTNQYLFAGWYDAPITAGNIYFYYKTTGNPISFKQPSPINYATVAAEFKVFPNPTVNQLTIAGTHHDGDSYSIIDLTGKKVMTGNITLDNQTVNVNNLSNGIYILNIISSNKTQKIQFVKE